MYLYNVGRTQKKHFQNTKLYVTEHTVQSHAYSETQINF